MQWNDYWWWYFVWYFLKKCIAIDHNFFWQKALAIFSCLWTTKAKQCNEIVKLKCNLRNVKLCYLDLLWIIYSVLSYFEILYSYFEYVYLRNLVGMNEYRILNQYQYVSRVILNINIPLFLENCDPEAWYTQMSWD